MIERLEARFKQMRQFSTDVSHELRTPITAIRGQLEVALFTAKTTDQYREAMFNALQDIDRLSQIVRALLLLSQAESGQLVLQKTRLNLCEVVRRSGGAVPDSGRRGAASGSPPTCRAECAAEVDRVQIERMITNLLSNALKFTPEGGEVRMSLQPMPDRIEMVVEDTGRGIPDGAPAAHLRPLLSRARTRNRARPGAGTGPGAEFRRLDRQSARRQDRRREHAGEGNAIHHHAPIRRCEYGRPGTGSGFLTVVMRPGLPYRRRHLDRLRLQSRLGQYDNRRRSRR